MNIDVAVSPTLLVIDTPALALCATDDKLVEDTDDVADSIEEIDGDMESIIVLDDVSKIAVPEPTADADIVA